MRPAAPTQVPDRLTGRRANRFRRGRRGVCFVATLTIQGKCPFVFDSLISPRKERPNVNESPDRHGVAPDSQGLVEILVTASFQSVDEATPGVTSHKKLADDMHDEP